MPNPLLAGEVPGSSSEKIINEFTNKQKDLQIIGTLQRCVHEDRSHETVGTHEKFKVGERYSKITVLS
ncbi:hypothetical protein Tco_0692482 [Tanacetum coccineum]